MDPVQWGVLGVSGHYRLRCSVPALRADGMKMRAIASRSADRAAQAAIELGIPESYGSYEELLADRSIEAVYIPLPNHMHLEWIKRAADAGKHILCEKPLGLNAGEVEEAIAHTREQGVLLMEAFMYRLHPQWVRARELIHIGEIGDPIAVQSHFFYNNVDPDNIRNIPEVGGGGMMDIGCYAVSSARFLLGREPHAVMGMVDTDPSFGIDRLSSGLLDFGDGVHATFTVGTQTFGAQSVQIFGSGGFLRVELPFNAYPDVRLNVQVTTAIGSRTISTGPADQYQLQFEEFSRAVRGHRAVPIPIEDARANQSVLDALFKSAASGERVTV
jgi:predicted dehydrogenase